MEFKKSNITIHMVASLDGFIAKKDNNIDWFETTDNYDKGILEQDVAENYKTIDCYIMGANTYQFAMELSNQHGWVYGTIPTFVITNKQFFDNRKNIFFYGGDLIHFVQHTIKPTYKNIWVVGGPTLIQQFIELNLVDEIHMSILPILLGEGIAFFNQIKQEQSLHLKDVIAYKTGIVALCYTIKR
ncbi:MAG: dihydrofolate reductase family protein [Sediminibacterium sp.]|nr:dihydrofolate reductase family protein [Sediminibacterium sp.]